MTESKQKEFERELLRKEYESYDKLMHVLTHEIHELDRPDRFSFGDAPLLLPE